MHRMYENRYEQRVLGSIFRGSLFRGLPDSARLGTHRAWRKRVQAALLTSGYKCTLCIWNNVL